MSPVLADRPTWLEIDAAALAGNVAAVKRRLAPGCRLMAVVKANAYGHGAVATTQTLLAAGADRCAVATLGEGCELRNGGVTAPMLVLGYTPGHLAAEAVRAGITLAVVDVATAQAIDAAAASLGTDALVHVKVNTGMNRLGVAPEEAPAFLTELAKLRHVTVEGIFTHFATSDTDRDFAREQFARFDAMLTQLAAAGLRPPVAHAANSAAMLTMPETHLDMVRCGIALYGLDPDVDDTPLPDDFRPALSWKAQVAPGPAASAGRCGELWPRVCGDAADDGGDDPGGVCGRVPAPPAHLGERAGAWRVCADPGPSVHGSMRGGCVGAGRDRIRAAGRRGGADRSPGRAGAFGGGGGSSHRDHQL